MNKTRHNATLQRSVPRVAVRSSPRVNKARSLANLSDKLNTIKDEYRIARAAVDGLVSALGASAGLLMVRYPSDLVYAKHVVRSESMAEFERTLKARGDKVLSLFALESHKRVHESDGLLLIPLLWQGKTIGLFAFDGKGKLFSLQDLTPFLSVCNQVAALFGMRDHQSSAALARPDDVQQDEIERAIAVQQSLLPTLPSLSCGLSIVTHTQAAEYVGGDYFDLILVDERKIGIVIADVEGKGVSAALFGNLLRTTVQFLTRETPSTASVLAKINSILHKEASTSQKLFTLFYAVYDANTKLLTYTGSGHVNPVVIRATGEVEHLVSEGIPIGIEPRQRFNERSLQLEPGDLVVYFTDGLIDCTDARGSVFGEERLIRILVKERHETVNCILETVQAAMSEFIQAHPSDDLTIIVTKAV
jgi:sigma-B regulation protein RsbU (phosphoserine phosphatase)